MANEFQYSKRYSQLDNISNPLSFNDYFTISRKLTDNTYKTYIASLKQLYDYTITEIRYNGIFQQLTVGSGLKLDTGGVITVDAAYMDNQYIPSAAWPFNQVGSVKNTTLPFTFSGSNLIQYEDIPVHNEGITYLIKAQTYSLGSLSGNATVYCYVVIFNGIAKIKFSTSILPEHIAQIYVGTITNSNNNITATNLNCVTRWEVARPSTTAIGSAIPATTGNFASTVYTAWENTTTLNSPESEYRWGIDDIIDSDRHNVNYTNYASIVGESQVLVGKTINLTLKTNVPVTNQVWVADATTSTSVNQTGVVTAVTVGTSMITCTVNNSIIARRTVKVYGPTITVTVPNSTVYVNTSQQASVSVSPNEFIANTFSWSSTNGSVASVNSSGVITGVGVGSAVILCTVNGIYSGSVAVQVTAQPVVNIPIINSFNGQLDLMKLVITALNREPQTTDVINFYIPPTTSLTASSIEQYAVRAVGFPQNTKINIINAGFIFGSGGRGNGSNGGDAIYSDGTAIITITNSGKICGGGGGGASFNTVVYGGGGAPFGIAGDDVNSQLLSPEGASSTVSGFGGVAANSDGTLAFGGRGGAPGFNGGTAFSLTPSAANVIISGGLAGKAIVGNNVTVVNINGGILLGN